MCVEWTRHCIFIKCVCMCVHTTAYLWRTEDDFQELVLSFHPWDLGRNSGPQTWE